MTQNFLLIIDGLNGAGKSTVAKIVHTKSPRTVLLSYDKIKRLLSDFAPNEEYHALTNFVIRAMAKEYFDHDINVIIESYIPSQLIAKRYTGLAKRKDVRLYYYQREAPIDIRMQRILQRPLVEGAKKKMSLKRLQANDAVYFKNKVRTATVIQTHEEKPERIARRILKEIQQNI